MKHVNREAALLNEAFWFYVVQKKAACFLGQKIFHRCGTISELQCVTEERYMIVGLVHAGYNFQ